MPEQDLLDMQYDLAKDRGILPDDNMPSKSLLYFYSKYKKEREEQANRPKPKRLNVMTGYR